MKPVILRPAAEADLTDIWRWYENQRPGLGHRFLEAATEAAEFIGEMPEA